ncbi:MAG: methyltransferase [Candidatus Izemoplasma sp.]|nr:methyltransferase [Candidatus Izemoplasma sp.]
MPHYFSNDTDVKSNRKQVTFDINHIPITVYTDHGVFNKGYLDLGTQILLNTIEVDDSSHVLDLGCGSGIIGIYLTKKFHVDVDMVDINERAVALTKDNLTLNNLSQKIWQSDGYENINRSYDMVVLNPPIHAGKRVVYRLFEQTKEHLNPGGKFVIVMHKKHGAKSAIKKLNSIFNDVRIVTRDKGFYVIIAKII